MSEICGNRRCIGQTRLCDYQGDEVRLGVSMEIASAQGCSVSRFMQNRLSFEIVAFLQAGLLAFFPVSGFLNHGPQFVDVQHEETAGAAFFAGG